jgi:hypothetical protein
MAGHWCRAMPKNPGPGAYIARVKGAIALQAGAARGAVKQRSNAVTGGSRRGRMTRMNHQQTVLTSRDVHIIEGDNAHMGEKPLSAAEARSVRWVRVYWAFVLFAIAGGEAFVWMRFREAQDAYRYATSYSGCPDECLGVLFDKWWWGFMLVGWPMLAFFIAGILWFASIGLGAMARRIREHARQMRQ